MKIVKNMCFAVEVGCFTWLGDRWAKDGVKIEHCGVVTDTGFEPFYRFPEHDLIVCGLPGDITRLIKGLPLLKRRSLASENKWESIRRLRS